MRRTWGGDKQAGFTLIELLIVVAIIAILAAILIPNFLRARRQALVAATKSNIRNIATVLEEYYVDHQTYPTEANWLVVLVPTYTSVIPAKPGGGSYGYKADSPTSPQNFLLCDTTTDTMSSPPQLTTWYWLPPAGLFAAVGPVDLGFGACP